MKSFFKVFFPLLVVAAVYTAFASYTLVRKDMLTIVIDESSGGVVYAAMEGQRFILYNALWWKYSTETLHLRNFSTENIRIDIPSLKELKDDVFAVIIPIKADFSVNPSEMCDMDMLKNDAEGVRKAIKDELKANLDLSTRDYLLPYRGDLIIKEREAILDRLKESVSAEFADKGIIVHDLKYAGVVSAPDDRHYEEGIAHLSVLRRALIENDRKLVELKGQLERDSISAKSLYNKYREMSLIIGKNPDILKYIYIDKMAPNLRLIVSSDKNAFPAFLGENEQKTAANKNIETEAAPKGGSVNAE